MPNMLECGKARPMYEILMLGSAPILRQETIAAANDLRVEVGRELRPVVGQTTNPEVPTQIGQGKIDILMEA
jgi:hypothetical protein